MLMYPSGLVVGGWGASCIHKKGQEAQCFLRETPAYSAAARHLPAFTENQDGISRCFSTPCIGTLF